MTAAALPLPGGFPSKRFERELSRELVRGGVHARYRGLRGKIADRIVRMAGFSNAVENKILDHIARGTAAPYATPSPLYIGLTTVAVAETDTSATVTEALYTGYVRLQAPAADWNAASAGAIATAVQKAFANCTAGTSTVIGWFLSPIAGTAGAGDVVMFGTCPSVTISTTQTPPTIGAGALSLSLD